PSSSVAGSSTWCSSTATSRSFRSEKPGESRGHAKERKMRLVRDTHIDFMKYRKFWIIVSLALVVGGLLSVFDKGWIRLGIDFAGGTQINLRFKERPDVDELRKLLESAGLTDLTIQSYNREAANDKLDLNAIGVDATTQLPTESDPDGVAIQGPDAAKAHYQEV